MSRKVSCGARSVCFLLPQYRGRDVSQTRNTHGISKALQYLKTQRFRPGSQQAENRPGFVSHFLSSPASTRLLASKTEKASPLGWATTVLRPPPLATSDSSMKRLPSLLTITTLAPRGKQLPRSPQKPSAASTP